jgi:hypothetical protein
MIMALRSGSEYYTEVNFTENEKSTLRRMHRFSVQTSDGQIHTFEGKVLPDKFVFDSGHSHKGDHLGGLFGLPREKVPASLKGFIPGPRDWVYVIIGAALVVFLKAALILAADTY